MKHFSLIGLTLFLSLAFISCDEGDIQEEKVNPYVSGRPVKFTGHLTGITEWGGDFNVVLAMFNDEEDKVYDIAQMRILPVNEDKDMELIWDVNAKATSVELCIVSALRERVLTFAKVDITAGTDTIHLDAGKVNVGLYATTLGLFKNSCVRCHGEGEAAQLWLDSERAYSSLVNKPAYRAEFNGQMRVVPGDAEGSILHQMLDEKYVNAQDLGVNHKAIFRSPYPLTIIDKWIDKGAKQ